MWFLLKIFVVVICAVNMVMADDLSLRPAPDNADLVALRLRPNRYGQYYVRGKINGVSATFLVDTGASFVSIPEPLARRLHLARGETRQAHTAAGTIATYATTIANLEIGPIHLNQLDGLISPKDRGQIVLLGQNVLRLLRLEQQPGGALVLTQRAPNSRSAPIPTTTDRLFRRSLSDCSGPDKRIDERVLRCLRGD